MAIWISSNSDSGWSLNSRDSFPRWKFNQKAPKGAAVIAASMHGFASFRKFKSPVTLTLTLGRVKVTSTYTVRVGLPAYPTIWLYLHEVPKYVAIWMSWNIDIPWSMNCSDTFPRKKFGNRAMTGCRPGPILSTTTVSFELHVKVAEEIDLETCSYGQLSEVQMVRDLDLDLGSGQGRINIHSTCRTTSTTVASRSAEIRPFEFREISTIGEVWTLVIAFLWGNSKIGLRQAVDQIPYYDNQPSVLSYARKWRRR